MGLTGQQQIVSGGGGSGGTNLEIDFVATETIAAYQVVTSDGKVGNSATISQKNKIIGIAKTNVAIGFAGKAIGFGEIQNVAWAWTVGDKIFLNGILLSTSAPATGFSQQIGTAIASDTIDVKDQPSVLL